MIDSCPMCGSKLVQKNGLVAYGCNSSTIYSTYDVTNNLVMEELFIENEEIIVEDNMSIYITKEIY